MATYFSVEGLPATKGSMKPIIVPGQNRVFLRPDRSEKQAAWKADIRVAAKGAVVAHNLGGPLEVIVKFFLLRPKGHYTKKGNLTKSASAYPMRKKDDLDKLLRAALDALTGIMWIDDGQISKIVAAKEYSHDYEAGMTIRIEDRT